MTDPPVPNAGLCARCRHRRTVVGRRGARYLLCRLAALDPAFPRYPRLPVLACSGFAPEALGAPEAAAGGAVSEPPDP